MLILVHVDAAAHLIGLNLRINPYFIQETGMGPTHNLGIGPMKAPLFEDVAKKLRLQQFSFRREV